MNRKELIRLVFNGERSNRIPRAIFGAGRWAWRRSGLEVESLDKDPGSFANALAALYKDLDTDIVFAGSGMNTFPAEAVGGEIAFKQEQAPLLRAPIIEKTEDARYLSSVSIDDSPHSRALIEMIRQLRMLLPDRFLVATSWGPFTWAMILCEWNMLQDKTVTDREFIREVCGLGVRLSSALFDRLIDEDLVDGIVISDGASTLIPLDLYRDVVLPFEKMLFDHFSNRGVTRFFHQCGKIEPQIELYPDAGPDCITLDAGVNLGDVYRRYKQRVVVAGNVDVIKTVFGGNPESICSAVSECLSGVSDPFQKFILMPSCDLPPETSLENAKAFLACADQAAGAQ